MWASAEISRGLWELGIYGYAGFRTDQEPAVGYSNLCGKCASRGPAQTRASLTPVSGIRTERIRGAGGSVVCGSAPRKRSARRSLSAIPPWYGWWRGILNRYQVGVDGRTPCQRLTGRNFIGNMLTIGSAVMFRAFGNVRRTSRDEGRLTRCAEMCGERDLTEIDP